MATRRTKGWTFIIIYFIKIASVCVAPGNTHYTIMKGWWATRQRAYRAHKLISSRASRRVYFLNALFVLLSVAVLKIGKKHQERMRDWVCVQKNLIVCLHRSWTRNEAIRTRRPTWSSDSLIITSRDRGERENIQMRGDFLLLLSCSTVEISGVSFA